MSLDAFLRAKVTQHLSPVKIKILTALWNNGSSFPREWVSSSDLLALTNQKYFDRRTRELRDELGLNIETKHINGEHHYRLVSDEVTVSNPRLYLTEPQKRALFEAQNSTCQICGKVAEAGLRGLQADHKVPLIKGGTHAADNWQSICVECNVAKRRACQGCNDDCNTCVWAFPETSGMPLTLRLPREVFDRVQSKLEGDKDWLIRLITNQI